MNVNVLGVLELSSIADGLKVLDSMVKTAPVTILKAETINPGKYLILISGDVASVEYAMDQGLKYGKRSLIDHLLLKNIDEQIIPALISNKKAADADAIGILETLSVAACLETADMAVKASGVKILEIQTGNELGGKAALKISGTVGEVEDAMRIIVPFVSEKNQLYRDVIITGPHSDIKGFVYGN